jgi:hypothetical protein
VDIRDVIARGTRPGRFVILEAAEFFRVKRPEDLQPLILVQPGSSVEARQVIAGKSAARGRRLTSPVTGRIAYIGDGRIVVQETPEVVEVAAGLIGQVVSVREQRGAVIETLGAVLQGVWGNGHIAIGPLRMEAGQGLETIVSDQVNIQYRGALVVTRRPIQARSLQVMQEMGMAGVIAPSMDASLIERAARDLPNALLLTEGFGAMPMSQYVYSFLESLDGKQATLDAVQPGRFEARRPEVIVNQPPKSGQRPGPPDTEAVLQPKMAVRLTRGPYAGLVGQVVHLPKTPYLLENGLRVPCAQVALATGEATFVPLANLEVFG